MRLVLVVLLVVLVVPAAGGQVGYDLSLDGPEATEAIEPDVGAADVEIRWTVTCTVAGSPGGPGTGPATLQWAEPTADAPGMIIKGKLSTVVELPDCATSMESQGTHPFTVQATGEVPGLTPITLGFQGTLQWQGPTDQEASSRLDVETSVTYVGLLQAEPLKRIDQAGPGETSTYTVNVTNHGNAASKVRVLVDNDRVEVPALWPDTPLAVGESRVLEAHYRHPDGAGWNNDEATFTLELTPVAADDENQTGQATMVHSLARTRGVPGLGAPVVAMAAAASVWMRRR